MIAAPDQLPDDIGALKALVLHWTEQAAAKDAALVEKDAELARVQDANSRLWETLRQLRRAQFGRKSEKLDPDQLSLAMEETEQAIAEAGSAEETSNATLKASPKKTRSVNRGALPSFSGILQVDGYAAYKDLASSRPPSEPLYAFEFAAENR